MISVMTSNQHDMKPMQSRLLTTRKIFQTTARSIAFIMNHSVTAEETQDLRLQRHIVQTVA